MSTAGQRDQMSDSYDLQRFVGAQDRIFEQVRAELSDGRKRSHWMWFIFPQIQGLGFSETARRFAITARAEAVAYLAHPVLGPRLRDCTRLVNAVERRSAHEIFGSPDDLKFRSSMTLFANAGPDERIFQDALDKYFGGESDRATLDRI